MYSAGDARKNIGALPPAQTSVRAQAEDYCYTDPDYIDSHGGAQFATSLPPGPADGATVASNTIVVASSPWPKASITLKCTAKDGSTNQLTWSEITPFEAAAWFEGFLIHDFRARNHLPPPDRPPENLHQIQGVFELLDTNDGPEQPRWKAHRHQWATVGGETTAGAGFQGFLTLMLTESACRFA